MGKNEGAALGKADGAAVGVTEGCVVGELIIGVGRAVGAGDG